jgi:carbohydrate kinase (thermoresistant glucokinase family)
VNAAGSHAVLACSALRQAYRDRLASAGDVRFVHLAGDLPTIAKRIETRRHRYMPASLLASQFATLEPPADAIVIDVRIPLAEKVDAIRAALGDPKAAPR